MLWLRDDRDFCRRIVLQSVGISGYTVAKTGVFVTKSCAKPRKGIKIIIFIFLIFSIGVLGFELS